MKKRILTLVFFCVILRIYLHAQCGTCVPLIFGNDSSIQVSATEINYDNTTGPLDTTIQMRFPRFPLFSQLGGNVSEIFRVQFTNAYDLPPGMQCQFSDSGNYDVAGGDSLACFRLCSSNTPPGTYQAVLYFDVTYSGFFGGGGGGGGGGGSFDTTVNGYFVYLTINVTGRFKDPYMSFNFAGSNLHRNYRTCQQSFNIYSESLINDACYIRRQWNLDGQNVSTSYGYAIPSTPALPMGNHFLALTTRVYNIVLSSVTVTANGVWDASGPDSLADMYIQTSTQDNAGNHTINQQQAAFNNLNWAIPLNECNNFEINVMDYDGNNVPPGSDIQINKHWFTAYPGTQTSQLSNSQMTVVFDTALNYVQTDTFWFVTDTMHGAASIIYSDDSVCQGDVVTLTATPYNPAFIYMWARGSTSGAIGYDETYSPTVTDNYYVKTMDSVCYKWSTPKRIVVTRRPFENSVIVRTGDSLQLFPHQQPQFAVEWWLDADIYLQGPEKIYAPFSGTYTALVYNRENHECSYPAYYIVSGVPETAAAGDISVYPNPARDYVEVNMGDINSSHIRLLNSPGQEVLMLNVSGSKARIETGNLPAGIYILQVASQAATQSLRLVLE